MEDYRLVTQRIINKGERILAEKRRRKKRIFRYIATVSSVCGAMSLCISAVAVLKIFIAPEPDPKPETHVTTQTTQVSQTLTQTETTVLSQTTTETTEPVTETEEETTVTTVTEPYTEEVYTEPPEQEETSPVTVQTEAATETEMTTTEAVTSVKTIDDMPIINYNGADYAFNGVYITQSDAENIYIAWTEDQTL